MQYSRGELMKHATILWGYFPGSLIDFTFEMIIRFITKGHLYEFVKYVMLISKRKRSTNKKDTDFC